MVISAAILISEKSLVAIDDEGQLTL